MTVSIIVISSVCLVYLALLTTYLYSWNKIPTFSSSVAHSPHPKVSIIIPARNEEDHILNCVRSCLNQTYPSELIEIIVIDDQSEDNTYSLLEDEIKVPGFKLMRLGVHKRTTIQGSKKKAIAYGVSHASGDIILTTDADCTVPTDWVNKFVQYAKKNEKILITGPVMVSEANGLINIFQQLDLSVNSLINAAGMHNGLHQLGSAANLMYQKASFLELSPYEDNFHIASGDDVFLIQKMKERFPQGMSFIKSKEAIVETKACTSWRELISQRLRWAGKTKYLKNYKINFIAAVVWLNRILPWLGLTVSIILSFKDLLICSVSCILLSWIIDFIILWQATKFFNKQKLLWYFVPIQLIYNCYFLLLGMLSFLPLQLEWKDRKI
ncbi:MAG TPA: glycosyltransferase [Saprospiraceae bacterium]|nr:glycosyltransferase [Saprospiraceae bacterium]